MSLADLCCHKDVIDDAVLPATCGPLVEDGPLPETTVYPQFCGSCRYTAFIWFWRVQQRDVTLHMSFMEMDGSLEQYRGMGCVQVQHLSICIHQQVG